MQLVDTHCHIHEAARAARGSDPTRTRWAKLDDSDPDHIIARAEAAGVRRLVCVGCTLADSELAVDFVQSRPQCVASIGLHPHEADHYAGDRHKLARFAALATRPGVVAVGECGLDYFYGHSSKVHQARVLRFQLELALQHRLPLIFHVRDAFDDFWPIFDSYQGLRGVIHSFSAGPAELAAIIRRGLYVGLNGIMTFTKNAHQLEAARAVPRDRLLLETDAPFLTPHPFRGTICEPSHIGVTAAFLAQLRGESVQDLAAISTKNAAELFGF